MRLELNEEELLIVALWVVVEFILVVSTER
jgi:hypothetical protein